MFCVNCGAKIEEGSMFCQECGTKVAQPENVQPDSLQQSEVIQPGSLDGDENGSFSGSASEPVPAPVSETPAGAAAVQDYNPSQKGEKKKTSPCLIVFLVLLGIGFLTGVILIILAFIMGAKIKEYYNEHIAPELESEYNDNSGAFGGYDFSLGDDDTDEAEKEEDDWEDESGDRENYNDEGYGENGEDGFTDDELCEMALDFYEEINGYRPEYASVESEGEDGVVIGVYDDSSEKRTGLAYYCVGRSSGRGYDCVFGNDIDLLDPGSADYSFDNYGDQDYDEGLNEYMCSWSDFALIDESNWFDLEADIRNRRGKMPGDRTIAQMIINEIYARHGYIFKDKDLNNYFSDYSWYEGDTKDMTTIEGRLNDYETKNIKFLQKVNK